MRHDQSTAFQQNTFESSIHVGDDTNAFYDLFFLLLPFQSILLLELTPKHWQWMHGGSDGWSLLLEFVSFRSISCDWTMSVICVDARLVGFHSNERLFLAIQCRNEKYKKRRMAVGHVAIRLYLTWNIQMATHATFEYASCPYCRLRCSQEIEYFSAIKREIKFTYTSTCICECDRNEQPPTDDYCQQNRIKNR